MDSMDLKLVTPDPPLSEKSEPLKGQHCGRCCFKYCHMAQKEMQTWDSSDGYSRPWSGVWNKQNIEGSDLIPPPLPFVFRLKTKEDLQEPGVSC